MKIKRIDLDDDEMPETITAELTHDEAAYLAVLLGKQTGPDAEQIMPGGMALGSSVWHALTGGVFNRFYEDGAAGAARVAKGRE
jgi:hypothetical protein